MNQYELNNIFSFLDLTIRILGSTSYQLYPNYFLRYSRRKGVEKICFYYIQRRVIKHFFFNKRIEEEILIFELERYNYYLERHGNSPNYSDKRVSISSPADLKGYETSESYAIKYLEMLKTIFPILEEKIKEKNIEIDFRLNQLEKDKEIEAIEKDKEIGKIMSNLIDKFVD